MANSKKNLNTQPFNNGERLYLRSRINKERKDAKNKKELKKKEEEKQQLNTYKPAINAFSHKYYKRSYKLPHAETLYESRMKVDEDLEKKREEQKQKIEEDLTFAPQLSKHSIEIFNSKEPRKSNVYEHLYTESSKTNPKVLKNQNKILSDRLRQYTFHPSIPDNKSSPTDLNVLVHSKTLAIEERERFKDEFEQSMKFQPEIPDREVKHREKGVSIHEYLSSTGKEKEEMKEKYKHSLDKLLQKQKIQTVSTDLLEDKKKYIFSNIFEVLDDDTDGFISSDSCNIDTLNYNLREFLTPLIDEMNQKRAVLDKEQFIESSLKLYSLSTPTLRSAVVEAGKVKDRSAKEEYHPYRPSISQKSEELAKSIRPQGQNIEDILLSPYYLNKPAKASIVEGE